MSTLTATTTRDMSTRSAQASRADTVKNVSELIGRTFLAVLFLLSGLGKIGAYAGTAAYMSSAGVPSVLLPVVIATEVLGALAIILGWQTRIAALLLAGYSLLAALIFHTQLRGPDRDDHVPQERLDRRWLPVAGGERRRPAEPRSSPREVTAD